MRFTTILASTAVMLTAVVVAMPLFGSGPTTSLASPSRSNEASVIENSNSDNFNSSSLVKRIDSECDICRSNMKYKFSPCLNSADHKFCGKCLTEVMSEEEPKCPLCRSELKEAYELTAEKCETPPGGWEPGSSLAEQEAANQGQSAGQQSGNNNAQQPQGGNGRGNGRGNGHGNGRGNNGAHRGAAAGHAAGAGRGAGHGAQPAGRGRGRGRGRGNRGAVQQGGIRRSSRNRGNRGSNSPRGRGSPSRGFGKRSESGFDNELQQRTEYYPEMHERMESDLGVQQRSERYDAHMEEENSSV